MKKRVRIPRFLQGAILITVLSICVIMYRSITGYDVLYVTVPHVYLVETPSKTSPLIDRLAKGDRIFYQGEYTDQEGYQWFKVSQLFRPENAYLDDLREGWITAQSLSSGEQFLKYEVGFFKRNITIRNLLKWKIRTKIRTWISSSALLHLLFLHIRYPADKMLHILMMMFFSSFLFLVFLLMFRSKWATLFSTLLTSNALGLINEFFDQWSGTADFEIRDVLANAIGSVSILLLFFVGWTVLEKIYSTSPDKRGTP